MALPLITVSDFRGYTKIVANQFKEVDLEEYITLFREQYLREIVGNQAYKLIEDQTRQKWTDLLEGVYYDGGKQYHAGIIRSLIRFIYFEFIRDNFTSTQVGKVKGKSENSERSFDLEVVTISRSRFNQGVAYLNESLHALLEYYKEVSTDVVSFVDNLDNTYTLSVSNTLYLEDGDTFKIDGVEYTATTVTPNVSILFDAGQTGIDFSNKEIIWKPFESVEFCEMGIVGI